MTQDEMSAQLSKQLAKRPHGFKKFLALRVFGDEAQQTKISRMLPDSKERRMIKADEWSKILDALAESEDAPSEDGMPGKVPLRGKVGAGQAIEPLGEEDLGWVDAPADAKPETQAVEVAGRSMLPAYEEGTLIYYSQMMPPHLLANRRAVIKLADGTMWVKLLRPGTAHDVWTLSSINSVFPDMVDVVVEWAAPIDWTKPR